MDATTLLKAKAPEDVFGALTGSLDEQLAQASKAYRDLARVTHPDHGGSDEVFARLSVLWDQAQKQIKAGVYGTAAAAAIGVKIASRRNAYTLAHRFAQGDIADIFEATNKDGEDVVVKLVRAPSNNDLIENERRALRDVHDRAPDWRPYFLEAVDSLTVREPGTTINRRALVSRQIPGFYSLQQVRDAYPKGIDPRDMAWIWRHLLVAIGALQEIDVVHGAILPDHVMIHGIDHGVVLTGWTASVTAGEKISLLSSGRRNFYPEEVFAKEAARTQTDLYMGASTMLSLMDWSQVPRPLRAHFSAPMTTKISRRSDDAWGLKESFDDLIERLWGRRRYRPFSLPTEGS